MVAPILVGGRVGRDAVERLPRLTPARMAIAAAVLVVGYFLFSAAGDLLLSHRLNRDEADLEQEIAKLQQQTQDLERVRDYLRTDEYVEGVARRVLGLVRPGETLVIVNSSAEPTPGAERTDRSTERAWWEELFAP